MDDTFDERLQLARKLADDRRFAEAIALFNQLCETYPDRAAAIVDSANTFSRVFDYAGVAMRFAAVESRSSVPTDVWLAMADISERIRRPAWAERFYSKALSNPSAEALGRFSLSLERANNLDRGLEFCDRGLRYDSHNASCLLARGRILRRQKKLDSAAGAIREILNSGNASSQTLIHAGYELAQINDAQDDCAGAIAALVRAKQLAAELPETAAFEQRAIASQHTHHRFLTSLNAEYFSRVSQWNSATGHRLALLGGHPRSGTTLLEQMLDSHSEIVSAEETQVFGSEVNEPFLRDLVGGDVSAAALSVPQDKLNALRKDYFRTIELVLDQPIAGRLLLDKNPSYTDCIPVFARVFPEASYVIALRDPRDVVLSCFFQDLPVNDVTVRFRTLKDTAIRYANTMAMWLVCRENMDPNRWTEVRYESLVTHPAEAVAKVMCMLELPVQPAQLFPEQRAQNRPVVSPTYAEVSQPIHSRAVGKWKRYERWLGEAMPVLETFIEAFDY